MSNDKASQRYYDKYKRNKEAKAFYNSKAWKDKRAAIRRRDNYRCIPCWNNGTYSKGTIVHHKVELLDDWSLALEDSNLETVCHDCHEVEHPNRLMSKEQKEKEIKKKKRKINIYKA